MTSYIAVHKIIVSDPDNQFRQIGFDANGEPIRRKATKTIPPGAWCAATDFADAASVANLLKIGAMREATQDELAVKKRAGL